MTKMNEEIKELIEAAETFEKEAHLSQEARRASDHQFSQTAEQLVACQTQLKYMDCENKKLVETLIRHTKARAETAVDYRTSSSLTSSGK